MMEKNEQWYRMLDTIQGKTNNTMFWKQEIYTEEDFLESGYTTEELIEAKLCEKFSRGKGTSPDG